LYIDELKKHAGVKRTTYHKYQKMVMKELAENGTITAEFVASNLCGKQRQYPPRVDAEFVRWLKSGRKHSLARTVEGMTPIYESIAADDKGVTRPHISLLLNRNGFGMVRKQLSEDICEVSSVQPGQVSSCGDSVQLDDQSPTLEDTCQPAESCDDDDSCVPESSMNSSFPAGIPTEQPSTLPVDARTQVVQLSPSQDEFALNENSVSSDVSQPVMDQSLFMAFDTDVSEFSSDVSQPMLDDPLFMAFDTDVSGSFIGNDRK